MRPGDCPATARANPVRHSVGQGFACLETPKQQTNQHYVMKNVTHITPSSIADEFVSLSKAAQACQIKEVTLRSWCNKKYIQWQRVENGAKTRCLVRISDVRVYLAKRNPTAVGTVGSSPAMPPQAETTTAHQVLAAVPQEPAGNAAPNSLPAAPAPIPARTDQVVSNQVTNGTTSVTPVVDVNAAVSQSTAAAKPAPLHPPTSTKRKMKQPSEGPSTLLTHRAKNSMRKFRADELQKVAAWIEQRLANKFASNTTSDSSNQPTPAS